MNVFKRAILYLIRKKKRSILLLLLLFFMGLFMLAGLSIRCGAGQAAEDMRKSISSGLEIKMSEVSGDEIYATRYNENGELVRTLKHSLVTESVAQKLAAIPGVSGYYSEMGVEALYTGLNVAPGGYTEELKKLGKIKKRRIWKKLRLPVHGVKRMMAYKKSMEPLSRLSNMSLLLVIIVGIGAVLLTLILTLWERDRIHETGILMSFGILKRNIWWQSMVFRMEMSPVIILFSGLGGLILVGSSMSLAFFSNAHHEPKELLALIE